VRPAGEATATAADNKAAAVAESSGGDLTTAPPHRPQHAPTPHTAALVRHHVLHEAQQPQQQPQHQRQQEEDEQAPQKRSTPSKNKGAAMGRSRTSPLLAHGPPRRVKCLEGAHAVPAADDGAQTRDGDGDGDDDDPESEMLAIIEQVSKHGGVPPPRASSARAPRGSRGGWPA
jgi:hypothetical protein